MSCAGVWFRGDLRLTANPAVAAASEFNGAERAIPALLLLCPEQMREHDWAPIKWDLLRRHIQVFVKDAAEQGIKLKIEVIDSWTKAAKAVKHFAQENELTELHFNAEYPVHEQRRDRAVKAVLEDHNVAVHQHHGSLVVPPVITTQAGSMYQKFTPFAKAWRDYMAQNGLPHIAALPKRQPVAEAHIPNIDYPQRDSSAWEVGETAAREALCDYLAAHVDSYAAERDMPGLDTTSRLSPYWELGILSPWQAVHLIAQQSPSFPSGLDKGVDTWLNELIWREFYLHLMQHVPRLSYGKAFLKHTDAMQWRNNEDEFDAWCRGETGYPIVDAGMRQLAAEGWMHNRVRMIVAHFLVKDLMIGGSDFSCNT
jgi:deoxyribodipyrimidine photo-lyase